MKKLKIYLLATIVIIFASTGSILSQTLVSSIIVSGEDGQNVIDSDNMVLQMIATVSPSDASDKIVTWSVINGTGGATISPYGLLRGLSIGTVTVQATANDGSGVQGSVQVTISYLATTLQQDSLALVALYNNTNGPGWSNNDNWLEGPLDSWYGVFIDDLIFRNLNLSNNNLSGSIPPEFGKLSPLLIPGQGKGFNLSNNLLTGSIPPELFNIQAYGSIDINLSFNLLTGTIPPEIGNLYSEILDLNFSNNQLAGAIPPELGNLSGEYINLDLSNNQFTGALQQEIYNISVLHRLNINFSHNQLIGSILSDIENLEELNNFNVSYNNLSGAVPIEISNLAGLKVIHLSDNQFSRLPDLSALSNLDSLFIQNNLFTFRDIEPNMSLAGVYFSYAPQGTIEIKQDTILYLGEELSLSVSTGGENSLYQWISEDVTIGEISGDSTLIISSIDVSDAGSYFCEVTNTSVPGLTLTSYPANVEVLDAILVSNTNDSGTSSFRSAIGYANSHEGVDNIVFNIPGTGPFTIQPLSPLPAIVDPVVIDGYSQPGSEVATELPGSIATLLIELDGINLFDQNNVSGLHITAGNCTVRGLAINRFGDAGIHIEGAGGNIIEGNYIGTDINGTADRGNFNHGVRIWNSPNNIIGGETQSARNLISGNNLLGVDIQQSGSIGNQVIGNYIGVDITGDVNLANDDDGIRIREQANNNTIGPNNVISGNGNDGIEIIGVGSEGNEILRNRIGTNAGGYYALGNSLKGINLIQSANNTIGSNVISANGDVGISINGNSASGNLVIFNYIGTDWSGFDALLPNIDDGIRIVDAPNNIIGGDTPSTANIIAGNGDMGIEIAGSGSTGNHILGNYIGIGLGGEEIGNQGHGVFISASNNIIGGSAEGSGNVISNNQGSGIEITTTGASGNQILGNYIGTDGQGLSAKSNNLNGLTINDGASDNIIGNGNLISGNTHIGIEILSLESTGNEVIGNFIGTIEGGNGPLPNGDNGVVIGDGASENFVGPNNLISGNGHAGVYIHGEFSTDNQVIENLIGTNLSGTGLVSNHDDGINIFDASRTIIRGNVLCGAGVGYIGNNGIEILGENASGNEIIGNFIGTNAISTPGLGNAFQGIQIKRDAHDNIIGPGNVISGNLDNGILIEGEEGINANNNAIFGNYIGTNVEGTAALGNASKGVLIQDGASNNIIGNGNVISGNGSNGVNITGLQSTMNIIFGNYIGTNSSGTTSIPNDQGVNIDNGSTNNVIGGTDMGSGNIIAYNSGAGIGIGSDHNFVEGNQIYENGTDGIYLTGNENTIGGSEIEKRNYIYGNSTGVVIFPIQNKNRIEGNYIGTDLNGESDETEAYDGVSIAGNENMIINNLISGYTSNGILITAWNNEDPIPENNIIKGNKIGTNSSGTSDIPNGQGISINNSRNNIIGGPNDGERNLISGNTFHGIVISGTNSSGNIIQSNYIGTEINGQESLENMFEGIWFEFGASNNKVGGATLAERNIISGNGITNGAHGIVLSDPGTSNNVVSGNYIGLNVDGNIALGNGGDGVQIRNLASGNIIGGTTLQERNVISGNTITGMAIYENASENIIIGNYIGLDASGTKNIGHPGGTGIYFGDGANHNVVGGSSLDSANYIAGNTGWAGVALEGLGTNNNLIHGNFIGVNIKGEEGFGNRAGIQIYNGASNNQVGGFEYAQGNLIAYNEAEGIVLYNWDGNEDPTTGNLILSNTIHNNAGLGVDLGALFDEEGYYVAGDGVTANDDGDGDASPNNLQNYPVLDSISFSPGTVTVEGYLNSTPNTSGFVLQFFASKVGDNNAYEGATYGEGQTYLGSETVNTGADGNAHFSSTFSILGTSGQVITATATDPYGNTSEFSMAIGGVKSHILAAMNQPFHFSVNKNGVPNISSGDDITAVENAFQTWTDISTASIEFISDGTTSAQNASAIDGLNLVTFRDEQFPFAPGVLAIAAKTLKIEPGSEVAQIVDADIVFNPFFVNNEEYNLGIADGGPTETGFFDIQSVTTHEIGHVLGLIHTGVPTATMFFMIGSGTELRSLEKDDMAWASYRYPGAGYSGAYGFISGNVSYGDIGETGPPSTHPPVAGAMVLAIDTETNEKIHAYTDANGDYLIPIPVGATGSREYWIYIEPLDGNVLDGYNLRPGNISSYIYSNTIYTDYPNEFLSDDEGAIEITPESGTEILVSAGQTSPGNNLITNKDAVPPWIISVNTPIFPETMGVTDPIIITFSEAIDLNSVTNDNFYLTYEPEEGNITDVFGNTQYLGEMTEIILFSPNEALNYEEEYSLHIETNIMEGENLVVAGVTDLKGNVLTESWTSTFTTKGDDGDPPTITDVIPDDGESDIFITTKILVFFSESMNKTSAEEGFLLSYGENLKVEGAYEWNPENTMLTFTPIKSLLEGTEYTISLASTISDLAGNELGVVPEYNFTTVAEANPIITYLGPGDGETNITVVTPVVVDFSEPIDPSTISYSSFSLKNGSTQVPGLFEFLMDNSRVVFRPDVDLNFGTTYTINLTTGIFDVSETPLPMVSARTETFTTAGTLEGPQISYLDPPSGVVGSVVNIAGSGFDPNPANNAVIFNGTSAAVVNATLSNLAVKVPMGATSGPVTVSVGSELSNEMFFYIIPQSLDPCEDILANITAGSRSRDVAVEPEAGLAYVTNSGSNSVSVIGLNLDPPAIIGDPIPVGQTPLKIDINPQGTLAYVTNFTSHTVSVIDLVTNLVVETIHVGVNPYGIVVSADGKVYVSNYTSENVSVIDVDPASGGFNHVIANINTGTRNRDIDVTPEAGLVLITGDNGLNIVDVDPASINFNTIIANVNSGTRTRDVAVHPEAGLAFVTTEEGNLFVVDIYRSSSSFGAVIANITSTSKARDVRVSPEAMFVYVTNEDGTVSVFKLDYGGVENPGGNVIEPEGTYYWNISLSLHATIVIPDTDELEGLVIDPDAEKLIVVNPGSSTGSGSITVIGICCGPISPLKSIGDMIIAIQNMINNGTVNKGNGNALITKLDQAITKLGKDQVKPAINSLNSFINQVTAFWNSDKIPGEQASALIDATYTIIEQLENQPGKSYVMDTNDLETANIPTGFIGEIYPNPFSSATNIHYKIEDDESENVKVMLRVYNSAGQVLKTLVNQTMAPGEYITEWKGEFEDGSKAPDAAYIIELRAGDQRFVRKVILQTR